LKPETGVLGSRAEQPRTLQRAKHGCPFHQSNPEPPHPVQIDRGLRGTAGMLEDELVLAVSGDFAHELFDLSCGRRA
jgi:hypothetical protein